jgi:hypothetical protein
VFPESQFSFRAVFERKVSKRGTLAPNSGHSDLIHSLFKIIAS